MKLFSLDSPLGKAIALLADLCILNLLFLFSCLPIFTIGAGCAALYDTVHALLTQECSAVSRTFFSAFKRNFKRGTVLFLISAAFGAFMVFDLMCAAQLDSIMALLCIGVIAASSYFYFAAMALAPMTLLRSEGKVLEIVKEIFLNAIKGTWRTVVAVVLNLAPLALFLFAPALFMQTWMFWFLMGFAVLAYVNNHLLLKAVDPALWEELRPVKKEKKK